VKAPLLELSNLWSGYEDTLVVRGVDLAVAGGETVVLIGPNGHGKTTLLRTICGLIQAGRGEVRLEGEAVSGRSPEQLSELGIVHIPQGDGLFPDLTVEENLYMGAFPGRTWGSRRQAADRVYEMFPQLRSRTTQRARTLSGGERRQLSIGRGLMREARVLLIDEPSLGLAPVLVDTVYRVIEEIARRDTTLLLVEENFKHIGHIADRVCVMEMGQIVRSGSLTELLSDATVVESYLGAV
jgi:branched-chain amino acid transport system ATP-binding protein